jgi:hypothetical protein
MVEWRSRNTNRSVVGFVIGLIATFAVPMVGQESNLKEVPARAVNDLSAQVAVSHHVVRLQPNGRFSGRLRRVDPFSGQPYAVPGVSVYLIKNRRIMYRTTLDESGRFEINQVRHGVYSLVAAGSSGFASFAVQVLPANQDSARKASTARVTSAPRSQNNQRPLVTPRQNLERRLPLVFTLASQLDEPVRENRSDAKPDDTVPSTDDRASQPIAIQDVPGVEELDAYLIDPRDLSAAADFLQQFVPPVSGPPVGPGGFGAGGSPSSGGGGGGGGDGIGLATGLIPVLLGLSASDGSSRSSSGFGRGGVTPPATPPSQVPPPFPDFPPDLPPPPDPDPPPLISELKP